VDFLNLSGHFATRINNTGTWVKEKAHVNGGYYRPSTQVKGIADIQSTIKGRTVHIEVKIGKDRQSEAQKQFEDRVVRSGAEYWIVKDFDQFYEKYTIFASQI
jgi:ribosomal 50S subunit-recycling heat shock protein